ncbi:HET-domain-containing protein [Diaporthe eres]|nr:HET-domain-containing protein [Diaporthe eres]
MRLLNCRTRTLEVFADAVPCYAILSHTWEEDEVCFCDFNDPNIDHTSMKGWYKIDKSCEQALLDGLEYVWIDTVCIDKSSSAELSEAINSMFGWYCNPTLCYAYLSDLPAVKLRESRWFTRGWTLQEMIAPKEIKFYDKHWRSCGTKSGLICQLNEITGVDNMILLGGNLRLISVARIISWAAKRKTTRVEDMAYCLLGLFDISMPMLYGEGIKAFRRLQENIVKEYDDHSLFAWRATSAGDHAGLFAESPADFASSANIVPCLGRLSEPAVVTSRGVRISAFLTKGQDASLDESAVLGVLNCRSIDFDMESTKRIAIALRVCYDTDGSGAKSGYVRVRPADLFSAYSKRQERKSLYILKNNHFGDLAGSRIYFVRTLPLWSREKPFEFTHAYPQEQWDEENSLFRVQTLGCGLAQFALVFRQAFPSPYGEAPGCFVVFLGVSGMLKAVDVGSSSSVLRTFVDLKCYVEFRHCSDIAQNDLGRSWEDKSSTYNASAQGAGVALKCYASRVVVSGQEVYCVDLHVKHMDEYEPHC